MNPAISDFIDAQQPLSDRARMSNPDESMIGVVGAGVMGTGVAQVFAQAGFSVALMDEKQAALDSAIRSVGASLRLLRLLGKLSADASTSDIVDRIQVTTDLRALSNVRFVVENVTEKLAIKHDVFSKLDEVCGPDTIFASNTSAIPIARLAEATGRPDRVLGIHFMNPVPLKDTVEVIRTRLTSASTLKTACGLLGRVGKKVIVVEDSPGFVTNRVLMLTVNEAIFLVEEGVARAEDVDAIFRQCFGHDMGPLETADLIGLDTVLHSLAVLREELGEKFQPCRLLVSMVEQGRVGRKSGQGFYTYENPQPHE